MWKLASNSIQVLIAMKFLLVLICTGLVSVAVAYATVSSEYGTAEGRFGVFDMNREITPANAMATWEKGVPSTLPELEMPGGDTFDFGVMRQGDKGSHEFIMRNIGSAPMTLRLGQTTCKCTLGSLDSDELAPGEETKIKLEWTVAADAKDFEQMAEVRTNDPKFYAIQFKITGRIARTMYMEPKVIALGERTGAELIKETVDLYSYIDQKVRVRPPSFGDDDLDAMSEVTVSELDRVDFKGHEKASQGFRLDVNIDRGLRQGNFVRNLLVDMEKLDDAGKVLLGEDGKPQMIHVEWRVVGEIVGDLGLIPNPKLEGKEGRGWIYTFDDPKSVENLTAKMLVTFKGENRNTSKLSVGETHPAGIVAATIAEPMGQGATTLHRLTVELTPDEKSMRMAGNNSDDYGWVIVKSDNQDVAPMKILLKFALPSAAEWEADHGENDKN